MRLPIDVPAVPSSGVEVTAFFIAISDELFAALDHEQVWAHIPGPQPTSPTALVSKLSGDSTIRQVLVIRAHGRAIGTTSYYLDPLAPQGVEIGATLFTPNAWGSGVNAVVKSAMIDASFEAGAQWVQFRTDERNGRSAAAILKLPGAVELSPRLEPEKIRKDGTVRTSRMFRIPRPELT
ncbi:GNAT family N-acetyltransferase [Tsukamurella sputi]|uniref:GNAT family N-acetyltransferase n=1 Tax=Tsukamurella sputi TaxID=2591848 RepID=A0A5C5RJ10_9ACTN|nr:GNAT family N-acetyltransferase [Tsukamurella sputi]TWS22976.1 GNAT family N-acetyltransferase [Tsukamurella sputi]